MAIKGSLTEASLPDVIQLLAYSAKSGCLSVTDGRNFGNVFIKDGKIIYATILSRKQRLGDILVSKQVINTETLSRALEIQKSERKKKLGEILIELGSISRDILEKELKDQIEQTIFTMLTWESGYFNFEADLLPSPEEYTVLLSAQELLLEGARQIDEWRKIENKIPPFETVLIRHETDDKIPLTSEEAKIMELIDGSRSIDDILKLSDLDFFETCRMIYGLLSAGLLEKPEKPLESKKVSVDVTEYKNLGFAFYKTEMLDEAEREYRKVLEIDYQDSEALFYLAMIELARGQYKEARDNLKRSAEVEPERLSLLINLAFVNMKLKDYETASEFLQKAVKQMPENIRVKCNLGIMKYETGNYSEAVTIFEEVMARTPEIITPYIYLPVIMMLQERLDEAMEILKVANDRFPRFVFFYNNMAVCLEALDRPEDAEKLYRQALEVNAKDERVIKNLANFYYEAQILGAAKELYERIGESNRDWQVLFKLGNIHLRQGDQKNALLFWENALKLNPDSDIVLRNIEVLRKTGGK